jgi:hypothetical protein
MAKYDRKFEVVQPGSECPNLLIERAIFKSGGLAHCKVSVLDYDHTYELVSGYSREEALEGLDNLIAALQAVRQDLDLTTKE